MGPMAFVSRAGLKLDHALGHFGIDVTGLICADLGCNAGGFTDCLLQRGAARVYAIDTGYGMLDWRLRKDPRVVVMERTNAMHAELPERVALAVIDVAWTKQKHILPAARRMLAPDGAVVTLIKPHYEAPADLLVRGVLPSERIEEVLASVKCDMEEARFTVQGLVTSPIRGGKGNTELLARLRPTTKPTAEG
jgi:23S rRNA (cytidine1920-2'-O)/16S rRNA (cytidine1409-2'-O)-methyltransferase